jgi:hypothetical protein
VTCKFEIIFFVFLCPIRKRPVIILIFFVFFCFRPEEETEKVLEEELENCSALLEMEPDSKWTRYARILIMKALDPEKYHQVG